VTSRRPIWYLPPSRPTRSHLPTGPASRRTSRATRIDSHSPAGRAAAVEWRRAAFRARGLSTADAAKYAERWRSAHANALVVRAGAAPALNGRSTRRGSADGDGMPTLAGYLARFGEWTEIDSWLEGRFMESIARGAFKKTMREQRDQVKVTLNHGRDPSLGDRPLGGIADLREDDAGAYYEVPLLGGVPDMVTNGLRAGVYGSSFRFMALREELSKDPGPSRHNPGGLPERTLVEVRLYEFGPVTFPAYAGATAGVGAA